VQNTKVSLKRTSLPIKEALKQMFPTLLADGAEGMQQLEFVVDPEHGSILRSETPLRVSLSQLCCVRLLPAHYDVIKSFVAKN